MPESAPTEADLQALYQAAAELKVLAPWQWLFDSDIFALRDPVTDEVHYCCVMGNLGEHLALALYLGDEGLQGLQRIQSGALQHESGLSAMLAQRCLMVSFEDREMLDKHDRDEIKALGRRYRGRQAWPQFRVYTPGYFPWYLDQAATHLLTIAIEQTIQVARRARDGKVALGFDNDESLLLREQNKGRWRDARFNPSLRLKKPQSAPITPPIDELRLARLRRSVLPRTGTWEADTFVLPESVQNERGERPYFPIACLFVDGPTGMVLAPHLAGPATWPEGFRNAFMDLIEDQQVLPRQVVVAKPELRDLLKPLAEPLGCSVRLVRHLPSLEEARDSLLGYMGGV